MIRINLIPVPEVRKQEKLIIEAVVAAVAIILVFVGCYFVTASKQSGVAELEKQNREITEEINKLKAKVGEVEKYKQKLKTLKDQLAVINSLQAGRAGPVRMMDELTDLIPRKLWISSFKESNKKVTMQGFASDGPVIADFLDSLKTAKFFSDIDLQTVNQQDREGNSLQRFTINATVKYD
ncbi:MAG: hypothetical protein COV44_00525 [Deltaproteobacteria bacterium CG11_big_fil_rev_8_21_14_0_20_45_16]|nr:MAG: hypothetical protein COV44_00525 [Deltaproteobacteria bacterium CG11_big_fil_rev_8_21_14_0_20_45_16]